MTATQAAPASAEAVPRGVIPPEVPISTVLPLVISRGRVALSTPNSVAQVSALAAASEAAPANQGQAEPGKTACKITIRPAIPPLANTWAASRRLPLENFSDVPALRVLNRCESRLEAMKKPNSKAAQGQPPRPKIAAPRMAAAIAPLRDRLRAA